VGGLGNELKVKLNCSDDSMALKECLRAKTIEQIHDGIDKIVCHNFWH
jgi:hypothetical protein